MHALIAGLPGGAEWIILLIVAVLLFGGSRLAGLGKGTGRAIREFKEETAGLKEKDKDKDKQITARPEHEDDITATERDIKRSEIRNSDQA